LNFDNSVAKKWINASPDLTDAIKQNLLGAK
jgi:hypothetical protein